jgi:hypothetical protein
MALPVYDSNSIYIVGIGDNGIPSLWSREVLSLWYLVE